ncbi:MAG: hypothetical protein AAGI38_17405 [Bacteroidota bacterium]
MKKGLRALVYATLILIGYAYLHEQVPFLQKHLHSLPTLSQVLLVESPQEILYTEVIQEEDCEEEPADSLSKGTVDKGNISKPPSAKKAKYTGQEHLYHYFGQLRQLSVEGRKKKVRIAYFGDSMIEGDLITQSLRNQLQEEFGGRGVGFVPITSVTAGFRNSIGHVFSQNWVHHSFLRPQLPEGYQYGISGDVFLTTASEGQETPWVQFTGSKQFRRTQYWQRIYLYHGLPGPADTLTDPEEPVVVVTTRNIEGDWRTDSMQLKKARKVNRLTLSSRPADVARLDFELPDNFPIYGLSFEGKAGVYLDNFAARGNSGLNLTVIPSSILRGFNYYIGYDLVILHYGLNVVHPERTNFKSYQKGMTRVLKHLKANLPNASFLLVSVSDKSVKVDGQMVTDPSVPLVVEAQRKAAEASGVAFFNLYEAMGGRNSMVKWAESDPSLAQKDYTHMNHKGGEKLSKIIYRWLQKEYDMYLEGNLEGSTPSSLEELSLR